MGAGGSAPTQRVNAQATANAQGVATFTFPQVSPPSGMILQAVVAVNNVPPAASSNVIVGGVTLPPFLGANPWGPFEILAAEPFSVVSTGLKSGTAYTAVLQFKAVPASQAGSLPIPYGSSTQNTQGIVGGVPVNIADNVDELLSLNAATTTAMTVVGAFVQIGTGVTALGDYSTIEVCLTGTSNPKYMLSIIAENTTRGTQAQQCVPMSQIATGATTTAWLPVSCNAGDVIKCYVKVIGLGGGAALPATLGPWGIWGHGASFQPSPLRPDGRLYPTGAYGSGGAIANPILAAIGVGISWMLFSLSLSIENANNFVQASITVAGANFDILTAWGPGAVAMVWPQGLLLDENTGVGGAASAGATAEFSIMADPAT